jgi:hypothetical protein
MLEPSMMIRFTLMLATIASYACAQEAACNCACCSSAQRPESQQVQGAQLMCSPIVQDDGVASTSSDCPAQCQAANTGTDTEYAAFCLASCIPSDDTIGSICQVGLGLALAPAPAASLPQALSGTDSADVLGTLGELLPPPAGGLSPSPAPANATALNGTAVELPPIPPLIGDTGNETVTAADVQELAEEAVNEAAAGTEENNSDALVAKAQGQFATAAGLETRAAKEELRSARTLANTSDALLAARSRRNYIEAARAEIRVSALAAAKYARRAKKAQIRAQEELLEIEDAPETAVATAASAAAGGFLAKVEKEEKEESTFEMMPQGDGLPLAMQPMVASAANAGGGSSPEFVPVAAVSSSPGLAPPGLQPPR